MSGNRRPAAWLALAALVFALHAAPARAWSTDAPAPDGLRNLLRYSSCAIGIAARTDVITVLLGAVHCVTVLLDELQRAA